MDRKRAKRRELNFLTFFQTSTHLFKHCLNRGFVQANVSVLECSFSARSGFALEAELHVCRESMDIVK